MGGLGCKVACCEERGHKSKPMGEVNKICNIIFSHIHLLLRLKMYI